MPIHCFNPSQVQFTHLSCLNSISLKAVSIPHRFNSHKGCVKWFSGLYLVSIPHRFNSHKFLLKHFYKRGRLFQSLTGSIHTFAFVGGGRQVKQFQSLTGSIHTKFQVSVLELFKNRFNPSQVQFTLYKQNQRRFKWGCFNPSQVQFTRFYCMDRLGLERVSIPHRFNSHIGNKSRGLIKYQGFNPSQVQFTHVYSVTVHPDSSPFQSLTGSIHTSAAARWPVLKKAFQSLTGSIHTIFNVSD